MSPFRIAFGATLGYYAARLVAKAGNAVILAVAHTINETAEEMKEEKDAETAES